MKRAAHWIANLFALAALVTGYVFFLAAVILP
jgi:hypothetical protein